MGNQIPAGRGPFSEREWAILQAQADLIREHIATGPQRSDSGAPNQTSCHCFPQEPHRPTCPLHVPDLITIELTRDLGRLVLKELENHDPATNVGIFRAYLRTALKGNP